MKKSLVRSTRTKLELRTLTRGQLPKVVGGQSIPEEEDIPPTIVARRR